MYTKILWAFLLLHCSFTANAQSRFPKNTLSLNAFRNPSIGLEYQRYNFSLHAGYYPTNFESGITTEFLKAGVSYWFLPFDSKELPSSLYVGASYLRGLTRDYQDQNAFALETGIRWYAWKGLHLRLGVIALVAEGQSLKINPTPSIGYSFKW
jgi:hypothetical protein